MSFPSIQKAMHPQQLLSTLQKMNLWPQLKCCQNLIGQSEQLYSSDHFRRGNRVKRVREEVAELEKKKSFICNTNRSLQEALSIRNQKITQLEKLSKNRDKIDIALQIAYLRSKSASSRQSRSPQSSPRDKIWILKQKLSYHRRNNLEMKLKIGEIKKYIEKMETHNRKLLSQKHTFDLLQKSPSTDYADNKNVINNDLNKDKDIKSPMHESKYLSETARLHSPRHQSPVRQYQRHGQSRQQTLLSPGRDYTGKNLIECPSLSSSKIWLNRIESIKNEYLGDRREIQKLRILDDVKSARRLNANLLSPQRNQQSSSHMTIYSPRSYGRRHVRPPGSSRVLEPLAFNKSPVRKGSVVPKSGRAPERKNIYLSSFRGEQHQDTHRSPQQTGRQNRFIGVEPAVNKNSFSNRSIQSARTLKSVRFSADKQNENRKVSSRVALCSQENLLPKRREISPCSSNRQDLLNFRSAGKECRGFEDLSTNRTLNDRSEEALKQTRSTGDLMFRECLQKSGNERSDCRGLLGGKFVYPPYESIYRGKR